MAITNMSNNVSNSSPNHSSMEPKHPRASEQASKAALSQGSLADSQSAKRARVNSPFHTVLLETQYIPPIETFARIAAYPRLKFEIKEHWVKRSYRNRTHIAGTNGLLVLSVPLKRSSIAGNSGERRRSWDTEIAYDMDWRREHWQSFTAGYRRSPYFEYYEDDFAPLFKSKYETLGELNLACFRFFANALKLDFDISYTENWDREVSIGTIDLRNAIMPKKDSGRPDPFYKDPVYTQVFGNRHGNLKGLSIADLLFNEGPSASDLLRKAIS